MNIKYIELNNHPGNLAKLTVVVDADKAILGELVNKAQCDPDKYEIELKRIRHKRGLTANAYYWTLVEKLARVLGSSKNEIHEQLMTRYGVFKRNADGKPIVFSLAAGEDFHSVTPYAQSFAEGEINGKRFIHYAVLKGSSEMDNAEFAALLDGCISEAKEQGIETMTKKEVADLEYLNSADTYN